MIFIQELRFCHVLGEKKRREEEKEKKAATATATSEIRGVTIR